VRKAWLGYLALVVFVLAIVNFTVLFVTHTSPLPLWASHPPGMLAAAYLAFVFVFPSMLGRRGVRVLPPPGPPVATCRCGGSIGRTRLLGRMIRLTVHPDRLTLSPRFLGDYTVHGSDLRLVHHDRRAWQRTVIEHTSPEVISPVTLDSLPDDVLGWLSAIRRDPLPATDATPSEPARQYPGGNLGLGLYAIGCLVGLPVISSS
jgi:hypothetical protein